MSLGLDDKLLGEKTHYYCSSSEGEDDDDDSAENGEHVIGSTSKSADPSSSVPYNVASYNGRCTNTGPKGVVEDWRRYKQFETEQREEQERDKIELAKKLSFTCRSYLDDEKEKANDEAFMQILEEQFDELAQQYHKKRVEELRTAFNTMAQFGKVFDLEDADSFLEAVDNTPANITVIIHVYEKAVGACVLMNHCFENLASQYLNVKFCRIRASVAKLSINFSLNGLPTILVYKKGELIGNFVRLTDEFGVDIHSSDVESFLLEHGMLPDQQCLPLAVVKRSVNASDNANDSDSD